MPSIKTTMTTGSYKSASDPRLDDTFPLGQLPQGNDEFDAALKKLENTFNVLIDRLNALEGSLKVLQETNKKLASTVALIDPFNLNLLFFILGADGILFPFLVSVK